MLVAVWLLGACARSDQAPATGSGTVSQLRQSGRWIVDEQNRTVLLHGVNAVWKLKPYAPPDSAAGFTAADADWLRDHGFNSVRLGVLFAGVMPQQGKIDTAYLDQIDRVVQLLASRGIYVLFDFHQDIYNEKLGGEGFPDWAVVDDGVPVIPGVPFPAGYFLPAAGVVFDNFWNNTGNLWDHYRDAWTAVAQRWHAQDHHGGYDLMNEPFPGTQWATCANPVGCPLFDTQKLQPMMDHARAGIRGVDKDNIVFYEPNFLLNGGADSWLGTTPFNDANIGLSWHKYCVLGLALHSQGFTNIPLCPQLHQVVNIAAQNAMTKMGSTSLITEFGASDDLPDLTDVTTQADTLLTGWQYWSYKNWGDPTTESQTSGGQGLFAKDDDLSTVKLDKLKILERTYPRATAGTPEALSFDPASGAFSYRYIPAGSGETDIYVPVALHYPNGYAVTVSGASVTSAPNATRLTLRNTPGATEVRVNVQGR
ncbi:MAG: endoglycoceramidase [Nevskiaceae bacterium]|nr:MAG: endoglycoceramidase [Nevskiaceae bacterium]